MIKIISGFIVAFIVCQVSSAIPGNPNTQAWQLLMDNKPVEAKTVFQKNTGAGDKQIAGEAYRGLSAVADFFGDNTEVASCAFKSCNADKNIVLFAAAQLKTFAFARLSDGYKIREGYDLLRELSKKPSLFSGEFSESLAERYVNDGNTSDALRIVKNMGVPRSWMCIGPFDNISNAGYNTVYPPENEIDFLKTYPGKDGNLTKWNSLENRTPDGWLFMEHYTKARDAVFYFYANVNSAAEQEAYCAFGASGSFKIFVNGSCICADSVFRNTGTDVFLPKAILHKGTNTILVKLCHEQGMHISEDEKLSNFQLRFIDKSYVPLKNITYSTAAVSTKAKSGAPTDAFVGVQSPIIDSIVNTLTSRLTKNENDIDAAILLMQTYNGFEKTDEGQILARKYLKKFPGSSYWQQLYAESLFRSKKFTEAGTALKTAYSACPLNMMAWSQELRMVAERSDPRKVLDFIASSPEQEKASLAALLAVTNANASLDNKSEFQKNITDLEARFITDKTACAVLAGVYLEQGQAKKAEDILKNYLAHAHTDSKMYTALASLTLKQGDLSKATDVFLEGLTYDPDDASVYLILANLYFSSKKPEMAKEFIDKCLAIAPFDAKGLNLKGNILLTLGDKQKAKQTFTDATNFTSDNFNAWDNIRSLDGKQALESMAPLPSVDSIISATKTWAGRSFESGAILSEINDIFLYPNRRSEERTFFVLALPTQKAIDMWKEYEIGYNSHFQVLHITKAMSYRADGSQVQADVSHNKVVFKSLQPGDCIALEWTLKNYYIGEMARHTCGSQEFGLSYPSHDTRLRLVTPVADSIPYHVYGDSIRTTVKTIDDYRVTEFAHPAYQNKLDESFVATDWPGKEKVNYSTFTNWNNIAVWYDDLTRSKLITTLELTALADSLFATCKTPLEKVAKVHEFITGSIRYSFVSFRQSGWIPQDAHDVLATKIGDCKDMASLGKSLLDIAKIPSCLVLVNTYVRHFTDQMYVGPDFNHCILCYTIDNTDRYLDLTASELPMTTLPKGDQGAMALCIRKDTRGLVTLPFDKCENRIKQRTITATLDTNGTLHETAQTLRTGVFAGDYREYFRFLSDEKKNAVMHQILANTHPDVTLDTFTFTGLNTVSDSLGTFVKSTAKNTVTFSGTTAIFPLKISDNVQSDEYPVEQKRNFPIDMNHAWYDISSCNLTCELSYPSTWKPISLPSTTTLSSPYGTYKIEFAQHGANITCRRVAKFTLDKQIPVSEFGQLKTFLNGVSKSDAVQLLFYTK